MVDNLVQNAVQHNHHGGWVSIATVRDVDAVWLRVANSGPPMDPAGGGLLVSVELPGAPAPIPAPVAG